MGGVRKPMPITYTMMLIGTLALIGAGIPGTQIGFAGFFSKDAAIEAAYRASQGGRMGADLAFWFSVIAALLTSFYSWRLVFMTFEGAYRGVTHGAHEDHGEEGVPEPDKDHHHAAPASPGAAPAHESPWVMLGPLVVLALGAVFAGFAFAPLFIGSEAHSFWRGALVLAGGEEEGGVPTWVTWAAPSVTLLGLLLATFFYLLNQGLGAKIAAAGGPIHAFLYHKWYFDEVYDFIFVKGARALGDLFWKVGDQKVIDGLGPNGMAIVAKFGARQLRRVQTGLVYHYSFVILAAVVAFGAYAIWVAGAVK